MSDDARVRTIGEHLAIVQNAAQELDPGGPAGRALWCVDALCTILERLNRRVLGLERQIDALHQELEER